jgi:hypothetical protein
MNKKLKKPNKILTWFLDAPIILYFALQFFGKQNIILSTYISIIYPIFVALIIIVAVTLTVIGILTLSKEFRDKIIEQEEVKKLSKFTLSNFIKHIQHILLIVFSLLVGNMFIARITIWNYVLSNVITYTWKKALKRRKKNEHTSTSITLLC